MPNPKNTEHESQTNTNILGQYVYLSSIIWIMESKIESNISHWDPVVLHVKKAVNTQPASLHLGRRAGTGDMVAEQGGSRRGNWAASQRPSRSAGCG